MTCSVYDQFTLTLTSQWSSHEAFIYQPKVHHAHSCSYLSFSRNISVFLILFLSTNGIFSQDMQQNWAECWKCLCCMTKPSIWASLWTSLTSTNKSRESQAQVEGLEARQSEPDTLPFIPAWHSTWLGQTILSTCCKCLRHTQCRYHKWRNWVLTTTNTYYLESIFSNDTPIFQCLLPVASKVVALTLFFPISLPKLVKIFFSIFVTDWLAIAFSNTLRRF